MRESGEIYWFANVHRDDEPTRQELAAVSAARWNQQLMEQFAHDMPIIGRIIESTAGEIGAYPAHDPAIPLPPSCRSLLVCHSAIAPKMIARIGADLHPDREGLRDRAEGQVEGVLRLGRLQRRLRARAEHPQRAGL